MIKEDKKHKYQDKNICLKCYSAETKIGTQEEKVIFILNDLFICLHTNYLIKDAFCGLLFTVLD